MKLKFLLAIFSLVMCACAEELVESRIVSIELDVKDLTLTIGDTETISAELILDKPGDCDCTLEWSTTNENIVVIYEHGNWCEVKGISPGEAKITVKSVGGLNAACNVTVVNKNIPVKGITLNERRLEISENKVETLIAYLEPSDASNQNILWSSADETIATVNNGLVKGIKPGLTKVIAETVDGGFTAECDIAVTKDYQTQTKGPITLKLGDITASTVTLFGTIDVDQLSDYDMNQGGIGFIYTTSDKILNVDNATMVKITDVGSNNEFSFEIKDLHYDTEYHYTIFLYNKGICQYGEAQYFKTSDVNILVEEVTTEASSVTFKGTTNLMELDKDAINVGVQYSKDSDFNYRTVINLSDSTEIFQYKSENLDYDTKYFYRTFIKQDNKFEYGSVQEFSTQPISVTVGVDAITQTTAVFRCNVDLAGGADIIVGVRYWEADGGEKMKRTFANIDKDGNSYIKVDNLRHGTQYEFSYFTYHNGSYIYGDSQLFSTEVIPITISALDMTQTTVRFKGKVDLTEENVVEVGVRYSTRSSDFGALNVSSSAKEIIITDVLDGEGCFDIKETGLYHGTKYYYSYFIKQNGKYTFDSVCDFVTQEVVPSVIVEDVTQTSAVFSGNVHFTESDIFRVGVRYSIEKDDFTSSSLPSTALEFDITDLLNSEEQFTYKVSELLHGRKYYYSYYVVQNDKYTFGCVKEFTTQIINPNITVDCITQTTLTFLGKVDLTESSSVKVGIRYSVNNYDFSSSYLSSEAKEFYLNELLNSKGEFNHKVEGLQHGKKYFYSCFIVQNDEYIFGDLKEFVMQTVEPELNVDKITQTVANFSGKILLTEDYVLEVGLLYSSFSSNPTVTTSDVGRVILTNIMGANGDFVCAVNGLQFNTKYNYRYYIKQSDKYVYGEVKQITTKPITVSVSVKDISMTSATFSGNVEFTESGVVEMGILYSTKSNLKFGEKDVVCLNLPNSSQAFTITRDELFFGTTYNWCYYFKQGDMFTYGDIRQFITNDIEGENLSINGTANCYIASNSGWYKFRAVKGNSEISVGNIASTKVLWESFGSDVVPNVGDLIKSVLFNEEYVAFQTAETYHKGNAVISVNNSSDEVLWSWHIWFTGEPGTVTLDNMAGIIMSNNLGAVNGNPGLLYQWGRKDPFLGYYTISSNEGNFATVSTITWPSAVTSDSSKGSVDYAVAHPTTYITRNSGNNDWCYGNNANSYLWSNYLKTEYDPCPVGWRVIKGDVWSDAIGDSVLWSVEYNTTNEGIYVGSAFLPTSGYRDMDTGSLSAGGRSSAKVKQIHYWTAGPECLYYEPNNSVGITEKYYGTLHAWGSASNAYAYPVRCQKDF